MTTVHSVAQLHGGQVLLESREDAGTTVTIWVPVATPATSRKPKPATISKGAARAGIATARPAGHKVLLVEDDPLVREVIKSYLQRLSLEVYVARDGCEGLKVFQRHAQDLALIVSDVTMPNMDGIEFYRNIRKLDPNIRVILMSGDAQATREEALAALGSDRPMLLTKPFTLKAFTETVRAHLGPPGEGGRKTAS